MAHRIMTIEDDDPIATNSEDDDKEQNLNLQREPKRKRRNKGDRLSRENEEEFDSNFSFETHDLDEVYHEKFRAIEEDSSRLPIQNKIDIILERRKAKGKQQKVESEGEERKRSIGENQSDENRFKGDGFSDEDVNDTESLEEEDDDDEVLFEPSEKLPLVPEDTSDHDEDDNEIDEEEIELRKSFFGVTPEVDVAQINSFGDLGLSRGIQVGLTNMGLTTPTPIQAKAIPVGLMGKDICACAATGSGKTLAFLIPALDRLSFKPPGRSVIRVLVLTPTRELAKQVHENAWKLASIYQQDRKGLSINCALLMGGNKLQADMPVIKARPDLIVATPGRLVDHIENTPGFDLSTIEILILDEADRLLELGFEDHLRSIIKACKHDRQTMLFSATMTERVTDLMRVSLKRPCRLSLNSRKKATDNLIQEFVRIRPEHEDKREAIVLSLCKRTFKERCMIFVRSKKHAHRLRIVFGLADLPVAELHGSLTQQQRLESLQRFQSRDVEFLICSDLAGRGLDLADVETVINLYMPNTIKQYIHRVGRTARAGRVGRSISLVGEDERKLMRELYKENKDAMRNRTVKPQVVKKFKEYIDNMTNDIKEILKQEAEESELLRAEVEERRLRNIVEHHDEIMARPARQWIQTSKEKKAASELSKRTHEGNTSASLENVRREALVRKLEAKQKDLQQKRQALTAEQKAQIALVRQAKKERRPQRLRVFDEEGSGGRKGNKKARKIESGFDIELSDTSKRAKAGQSKGHKSSLLAKKSSAKKDMLAKANAMKKPPPLRGHKFKSKKRYKRR
eukprot:gene1094-4322_t